ncbi:MAG: 3-oxoacyl-ACP synthase [Candidatus Gallionella acididurans]|uniref:3-oxoacyl-ACP synthase n=1 Tax=Candidatus Gallionella acididurans TaxID=1796491 RepID=A0A139BWG8_9PROT|nr:MAG: 3-oxoacyl-ACP synthase [Candidatus Gallionella acididurans]
MKVFVEGVGIVGPGLNGWQASQPVLAGTVSYVEAAIAIPPNDLLPPAERRRTGIPVKLALAVGCEAIAQSQRNAAELPAVFASSAGDGDNMHNIFDMLAKNGREVSPTRFHNSVHNAPSGYWSIATKSMAPTTSLACFDSSFVAGLIEAATQTLANSNAVVLIAYDSPYPQPIHEMRPTNASFGVALVLSGSKTDRSLAELEISINRNNKPGTSIANAELEAIRADTPAARSLPLLTALSNLSLHTNRNSGEIYFDYIAGNQLAIAVRPC